MSNVEVGGLVIDVAAVGGLRVSERLFGLPARRSVRRATARRLQAWIDAGLAEAEQWLPTEPADTCVTLGRRRRLG